MARSVAASLVNQLTDTVDSRDMAKRFVDEFFKEPYRGYGASVGVVFNKLQSAECKEPFGPASEQFDGNGSYGNGAAMRIYPAAMYGINDSIKQLAKDVRDITAITHSHKDAINGAILQAYAVQLALKDTRDCVDTYEYVHKLREQAMNLEADKGDGSPEAKRRTRADVEKTHVNSFCGKLDLIKDFLQRETVSVQEIETKLGTGIAALDSVPAAIYSFLRASQPISGIETESEFERTIIYAISLGGDTDTIATMAGAIAGAFYRIEAIPESWQNVCEGREDALKYADELYERYVAVKEKSGDEAAKGGDSESDKSKDGD